MRRFAAPLVLVFVLQTIGCTHWVTRPAPWPETISGKVRITMLDGHILTADSASTALDSLVLADTGQRNPLPIIDVARVEERRPNGLANFGLFVGSIVGVLYILGVAAYGLSVP